MRTSKPISTISYNTISYLEYKLNLLLDNGLIEFYSYIFHKAEENEKKDHIHLYIEPSYILDTQQLKKEFEQIIPDNELPLGVMPFNSSKFQEWYLYCLHDVDYLRSKGLTRVYVYNRENFISSDINYFYEKINTLNYNYGLTGKILEAVNIGISFNDLIISGVVKVNNIYQAEKMYYLLKNRKVKNDIINSNVDTSIFIPINDKA